MKYKEISKLLYNGLVVTVYHNTRNAMDVGVNGRWFRVYCLENNWKEKTNELLEKEGYQKGIWVA